MFVIPGFRSIPTALCYWYNVKVETYYYVSKCLLLINNFRIRSMFFFSLQCLEQPSLLLLGDEKGGVHLMWFLKPTKGLFKRPSKKESIPQRIFFPVCSVSSAELLWLLLLITFQISQKTPER